MMFENVKNKVVNVETCIDVTLNNTFKDVERMLNIHNIDINDFAKLISHIEIGDVENENEYHTRSKTLDVATYYDVKFILNNEKVLEFWGKRNIRLEFESSIDTFNYVHELLNDGIVEKYYETKWLKKSKKYTTMIENELYRFHGVAQRARYDIVVKHNDYLKFIDEKLGEIVDKLNLDNDKCKNKFNITNNDCFVNSKDETNVVLKIDNNKLFVTFKHNKNNIDVMYRFDKEWDKI